MKNLVRTSLATAALVALSILALPVAAQASTIYPPAGSCSVSPSTITPGGTITFRCADTTFSANEDVTITVTGENGNATAIGMLKFAVSTASGTVSSTTAGGIANVSLKLPSDASGTYNIAAVSATSAGSTAVVTITSADGGLPVTGLNSSSLLGIWVGGAAVLLIGVALAVAAFIRRAHRNED